MQSLIPFDDLGAWRSQFASHTQLVLTNGCFDILHVGHVRYLQAARALGDVLMVGVNADISVRGLKGPSRPVNQEHDRAEILAALECVDFVTIFTEATADRLIEVASPQIYAKAGDYSLETLPERETVLRVGAEARFLPFAAGYSTTQTIANLQA